MKIWVGFLASLVLAASVACAAQTLTVAAAADIRPALDEIAPQFEKRSGVQVRVSYGSSGNFFQQIQNGAPFDVFLSANVDYPKKLETAGLTLPGSYVEFARGNLVLLVPTNSKIDLKAGLRALLDSSVRRIAIADPSHAPYGQAAVAALKTEELYDQVSKKLVTGENISQAASFVLSGAADAGIVAKSLALSAAAQSQTKYVEIPAKDYPPLLQAMVVLRSSKQQQIASQFEEYIKGKDAQNILAKYGFNPPGK